MTEEIANITEDTVRVTEDICRCESGEMEIEYYTLNGKKEKICMCPGDLYIICNVLYDLESSSDMGGCTPYLYRYHAQRCRKIQYMIEQAMDYSTQAAIEQCRKKRGEHGPVNVGEEAITLAIGKHHP